MRTPGGVTLEVRLPGIGLKRLPEWMTEPETCEGMVVSGQPVCGVAALQAARAQLDAWGRRAGTAGAAEEQQ